MRFGLTQAITEPAIFFHPQMGHFSMYLDKLNALYFLGVGVVTPMVALYSRHYIGYKVEQLRREENDSQPLWLFYMPYTVFAASMFGFVLATNLLFLYIFLNISMLTSFLLILLFGHGEREHIAKLYLLWSFIGSGAFLLGVIGLGAYTGTFDILDLSTLQLNIGLSKGLTILVPFLIFFGMYIKKALFGCHIWLPHAHAEAPAPVSAVLSANLIGISGYVMIRVVLQTFPTQFEKMAPFFLVLAFTTMLYGGVNALAQDDLKRLLAYASVAQMGWVVFGISTMTPEGMMGGIILYLKHSLTLSVLFMGSGLLVAKYDGLRKISNMGELLKMHPILSILMILSFLTFMGAPLTVGFWGKTLVFQGAINSPFLTGSIAPILAGIGIIFAAGITLSYSFITVKRMFFGMFKGGSKPKKIGWISSTVPMAVLVSIGIFLFFVGGSIIQPLKKPSLSLEAIFLAGYVTAYFLFSGKLRYSLVFFSYTFENKLLDRVFHEKIPEKIQETGYAIRSIHSGDLSTYVLWTVIGIVFFMLGWFFIS
ncbi:MAG: complex I subunit 4 family protein [Candidatus Natronoplasma sp.]